MEWTFKEFFAVGGTTTFIDRVSASLGIHASSIKIVSIYEGSLVVIYNVFDENDDPVGLENLRKKQQYNINNNLMNYGAPVLDVEENDSPIVKDGVFMASGYEPKIVTQTATNA